MSGWLLDADGRLRRIGLGLRRKTSDTEECPLGKNPRYGQVARRHIDCTTDCNDQDACDEQQRKENEHG